MKYNWNWDNAGKSGEVENYSKNPSVSFEIENANVVLVDGSSTIRFQPASTIFSSNRDMKDFRTHGTESAVIQSSRGNRESDNL